MAPRNFAQLIKAALDGEAAAQYQISQMYYLGDESVRNEASAFEWCKKAADQGLADAQHSLATMYVNGCGVEPDLKEAVKLFRKAAEITGVKESDCTVFDDSVASCRSARAAGMTVVGVYDEFFHVSWEEMQSVCHRTIRSFEELL